MIFTNKETARFLDELDLSQVEVDANALKAIPSEEKLGILATYAAKQQAIESEIATAEKLISDLKAKLALVSETQIPEMMEALNIEEFTLGNGIKVSVKPYYSGKITSLEAHEWLETNGHGDIIKGEVAIPFPKGYEKNRLSALQDVALALGLRADITEEVHSSTLRAWLKQMVESGEVFPRQLFNCFVGKRTKLSLR